MPRFAQHFLVNKHAIERIVNSLQLNEHDYLVEIGPGKAALTRHLVDRCQHLTVIEVDPIWVERLRTNFGQKTNLNIFHQDVLKFDFESLSRPHNKWKVVGNLPYNLTSPILKRLCDWTGWNEAWVMVQKEVGDRMTAVPGSGAYGALTVGLNLTCTMQKVFNLSQGSFDPPPKVESSVIYLRRKEKPLIDDISLAQRVIQAAFQQRRKTILNSLSHGLKLTKEIIKSVLDDNHIPLDERPEQLSPGQFVQLAEHLRAHLK